MDSIFVRIWRHCERQCVGSRRVYHAYTEQSSYLRSLHMLALNSRSATVVAAAYFIHVTINLECSWCTVDHLLLSNGKN